MTNLSSRPFIDLLKKCAKATPKYSSYLVKDGIPSCAYGLAFYALGVRYPYDTIINLPKEGNALAYLLDYNPLLGASHQDESFNIVMAKCAWGSRTCQKVREMLIKSGFKMSKPMFDDSAILAEMDRLVRELKRRKRAAEPCTECNGTLGRHSRGCDWPK